VGVWIIYTSETNVRANVLSPQYIGINFANEFFYIVSDIAAEIANDFYQDWFSFSYWLGDLVYRFFVVRHPGPFI
jgi:hypothetical protein